MNFNVKTATKNNVKLKMALVGVAGSGKTYSALQIARGLVGPQGRILMLDTEHGSANKYADATDFETIDDLNNFSPSTYTAVIRFAESQGYDALVIDSLSHAWNGTGGALEQVDAAAKRANGNSFGAWRNVTPLHTEMVEAIVGARLHIIATMRAKTEYAQEKDERGKTSVRKIGMAPIQRDGMEYEFDVVGELNQEHDLIVTKTRCADLDNKVFPRPGAEFAGILRNWLTDAPAAPSFAPPEPPCVATDAELAEYNTRREIALSLGLQAGTASPGIFAAKLGGKLRALNQAIADAEALKATTD